MIDKLFKFPIIMIDGHKEEKKEEIKKMLDQGLASLTNDEEDLEIIYGYAECPFDDFLAISDRWLPDDTSYEDALNSKFNACFAVFDKSGTYIVPWSREKFKKELKKFSDAYNSLV